MALNASQINPLYQSDLVFPPSFSFIFSPVMPEIGHHATSFYKLSPHVFSKNGDN